MKVLTRAYTRGLTKFEYPLPSSLAREQYLLHFLEEEELAEMLRTKSMLSAHLMASQGKEIIRDTFDTFKSYTEMILPTTRKLANIKSMDAVQRNELKDTLRKLNAGRANRK